MTMAALSVLEIAYPGNLYQPLHAHSHASVTLVLSGSLEERVGRRSERGLALGVVVKPAGVEHDDRFGSAGARTIQIGVTSEAAAELARRGEVLEQWRWLAGGGALGPFLRLLRALREGNASAVQDAGWDVLAATGRDRGDSLLCSSTSPPAWVALVRERVDDDPAAPHRVRDLAAAAGVHPVHLAREFRRAYAMTLSEYLQRRRIQAAAELLASSEEPLARVATRAGFADQSHLGRHLRARAGCTPSQLRRIALPPMLQPF